MVKENSCYKQPAVEPTYHLFGENLKDPFNMFHRDDTAFKLEKEQAVVRVKHFCREWEHYCLASKEAVPMSLQQSEDDATNNTSLDICQVNNDLAIFKRPATPPLPSNRARSRSLAVGTQTWAITRVINNRPYSPNETYIAPKPTSGAPAKPPPSANCVVMPAQTLGQRRMGNIRSLLSKPSLTIKSVAMKSKSVVALQSVVYSTQAPPAKNYRARSPAFPGPGPNTKYAGTIPTTLFRRRVVPRKSVPNAERYDYATVVQSVTSVTTVATHPAPLPQLMQD